MNELLFSINDLPQPTTDIQVLRDNLDIFGYCLIPNAIDESRLKPLQERLIEQAEMERELHNHKNPANVDPVNQWVGMLLNKGEEFTQLIQNETCMGLLNYMLGEQFIISCVDAQIQHPGATDMPLHTDQWWMPPPVSSDQIRTSPSELVRGECGSLSPTKSRSPISDIAEANVMWMITDFTEENGATKIVPGSHLSGSQPNPAVPHPLPTVAAVGPAGTAFAFDGRIWHGGAANNTAHSRYGITTAGCGPQFRPIENYTRGLRQEVFERLEVELLGRLGLKPWSGYGHTGNPDEEIASSGENALGPIYRDNK